MKEIIRFVMLVVFLSVVGAIVYAACGIDTCVYSGDKDCTVLNPYPGDDCCDDSSDRWYTQDSNSCCRGIYYTNDTAADDSPCNCFPTVVGNLIGLPEICDTHNEDKCWDVFNRGCCGDSISEVWQYSTRVNLSLVLPESTCFLGKWHKREGSGNITVYNLWYD